MLFITAIHLIVEAVERLVEPKVVVGDYLVSMSLLSLFVSVFNLLVTHNLNGHGHCAHGHAHVLGHSHAHGHSHIDKPLKAECISVKQIKQNLDGSEHDHCLSHEHEHEDHDHSFHAHESCSPKAKNIDQVCSPTDTHAKDSCCGSTHYHSPSTSTDLGVPRVVGFDCERSALSNSEFKSSSELSLDTLNSLSREGNFRAMIIHLIFDLVSSLTVVISCFFVQYFKTYSLDSLSALITSALICLATYPLLVQTLHRMSRKTYDFELLGPVFANFESVAFRVLEIQHEDGRVLVFDLPADVAATASSQQIQAFTQKHGLSGIVFF